MTGKIPAEPNRYARLGPEAQALVDDHDQIALATMLASAQTECDRLTAELADYDERAEQQKQRADEAEQHLRNIAQGSPRADAVQAEIGEMIRQTHELREQLRRAEAAVERARALAARWENALAPDHAYARSLLAALDNPQDQP